MQCLAQYSANQHRVGVPCHQGRVFVCVHACTQNHTHGLKVNVCIQTWLLLFALRLLLTSAETE